MGSPSLTNYRIDQQLGSGAMGVVYKARDLRLQRDVALKVLPPEFSQRPDRIERFRREAQSLASLNHPNIVTIYSVEEQDGSTFITMECVDGLPLDQLIPADGLPLRQFLSLSTQITDALGAAEEAGIMHRDLKPSNVMLTEQGQVKLIDLGLAKLVESPSIVDSVDPTIMATAAGQAVGTPAYMSPEQIEGRPLDHRSDIFSLGVLFFEMLTGARPFEGSNSATLMTSILRDEPRSLANFRTDLPVGVARILRRCLEKEPARRFQSAMDLRRELDEVSHSLLSTQSGLALGTEPRPARNWQRLIPVAIPVILALVAGILLTSRKGETSQPEEETTTPTVSPSLPALPPFAPQRWSTSISVEKWPRISPDGSTVAFAMLQDGHFQIFIRPVAGGDPHPITSAPRDHIMPVWSQDGQRLAFVRARLGGEERATGKIEPSDVYGGFYSSGGDLWLARIDGSDARLIAENAFSPSFSGDGRLAFNRDLDGNVQIWICDGDGQDLQPVTNSGSDLAHVEPDWSPDGRKIVFRRQVDKYGSTIAVLDLDSGETIGLTAIGLHSEPCWSPGGRMIYYVTNPGTGFNIWRIGVNPDGTSDGSSPQQVSFGPGPDINPALSPDGASLYFAIVPWNSDLWALPVDPETAEVTGEAAPLITSAGEDSRAAFSADGRILAFCSTRDGDMSIYAARFDPERGSASEPVQVTSGGFGGHYQPSISPDGSEIAFFGRQDGNEDIYRVSIGPDLRPLSPPVRLTDHPASDHSPFYDPTGEVVAFRSNRSGNEQLWIMNRDGTAKRQISQHGAFGHYTPWFDDSSIVARTPDVRDLIPKSRSITVRMFLDNRAPEALGANGGGHISLSPNRKWLSENDHKIIYKATLQSMERDESELFEFTDGSELDYTVWSPSGRWIIFDRNSVRSGDIYRVGGLTRHDQLD